MILIFKKFIIILIFSKNYYILNIINISIILYILNKNFKKKFIELFKNIRKL